MPYIDPEARQDVMGLLKARGISPTHQRLEVLRCLLAHPGHMSAEEVFLALQGSQPPLSKASVYNILRLYQAQGLVRALYIDARIQRYDLTLARHGHFQCERCGSIIDFTAALDEAATRGLQGYQIRQKDIYFRGLCPACQTEAQDDASAREGEKP
ncbi:MAG: Fur family transcriptional regulator [Christensenellales bacterium]